MLGRSPQISDPISELGIANVQMVKLGDKKLRRSGDKRKKEIQIRQRKTERKKKTEKHPQQNRMTHQPA